MTRRRHTSEPTCTRCTPTGIRSTGLRTAFAVYPGTEFVFFERSGTKRSDPSAVALARRRRRRPASAGRRGPPSPTCAVPARASARRGTAPAARRLSQSSANVGVVRRIPHFRKRAAASPPRGRPEGPAGRSQDRGRQIGDQGREIKSAVTGSAGFAEAAAWASGDSNTTSKCATSSDPERPL